MRMFFRSSAMAEQRLLHFAPTPEAPQPEADVVQAKAKDVLQKPDTDAKKTPEQQEKNETAEQEVTMKDVLVKRDEAIKTAEAQSMHLSAMVTDTQSTMNAMDAQAKAPARPSPAANGLANATVETVTDALPGGILLPDSKA